jgi:alkanesulfonate monooxygenase SsuD/methylene tetrahydromethanopterin reductase-like flavin-dependent oxidoreductase (luciferase family)
VIKLGYGLITCQAHPYDPRPWQALYSEALELGRIADSSGVDSIWVSEHHFNDDGYLPSVMPLIAALAAVTTRVSIGSAVLLAPFHDPIRLAEDAAVTDLISAGRLILGLGIGWRGEEFAVFDTAVTERVKALYRAIDICRSGWRGEPIAKTDDGTLCGYITPRPAAGRIPVWIGAGVAAGLRRVGRLADGFMAPNCTPEELGSMVRSVREEAERVGRDPAEIEVATNIQRFITDDPDPWSAAREHILYQAWKYSEIYDSYGVKDALQPPPQTYAADLESSVRRISVVGTASHVAERINEYAEMAGCDLHFVVRTYFPGLGAQGQRENVQALADVRRALS